MGALADLEEGILATVKEIVLLAQPWLRMWLG
jgi:hypothetical protein